MRKVSNNVKNQLLAEEDICAVADENCCGRLTWEHAIIFAGKQLDKAWAIVKICAYHHEVDEFQDGGGMDKQKNIWAALNKATDEELLEVSKSIDYIAMRNRLNKIYG